MSNDRKEQREKFIDVASKRMDKAIVAIRQLSNCSNQNNYEYTEKDIQKMEATLTSEVKNMLASFRAKGKKSTGSFFE